MRRVIEPQMKLGETTIADIKLDPKSRDDLPQILRGLQHIFITPERSDRPASAPGKTYLRNQNSAVESAINTLEVHGLDKCHDHGLNGFKRCIAMAVLARNIQRLGAMLRQQEQEVVERKRGPYKKAA